MPSLQERVFDQTAHFGRSALSWETFDCNAHIVAVSLYRLLMLATLQHHIKHTLSLFLLNGFAFLLMTVQL